MNIESISKHLTYYVSTDDEPWSEWRTNYSGTAWENLMGMSWEEMEPPVELIEQFMELRDNV